MHVKGMKIIELSMILIIPLVLLFYYQRTKLGIIGIDSIRQKIESVRKDIQTQKNLNSAQLMSIQQRIHSESNEIPMNKQKINDLLDLLKDKPILLTNRSTYYQTKHVINIQISTGFLQKAKEIKNEIEYQLIWLHQTLNLPNISILQWNQDMNFNEVTQQMIVVFRQFQMESMDENIALKIKKGDYRNQYYLKEIVPQLRSLPSFSHCKFTHITCKQTSIIFVKHNTPKERSYWQVDNEIYLLDQFDQQVIFNILAEVFQMRNYFQLINMVQNPSLVNDFVGIMQKLREIQGWQKDMDYLDHIMKPHSYSLSPYIHSQQSDKRIQHFISFISKQTSKSKEFLPHTIVKDSVIGSIDFFPNDFKIGVYLPLLVIFLYPCFIIIKQIVSILVVSIKGKRNIQKNQ